MTLSLANSVEEVEPGGSGCNTQSDSDSESSNSFRFTDVKDVKLMTGAPATTTSVVFKDSPYATVGDTINIHIVKANINGKEFEKYTNHNIDIPCESNAQVTGPQAIKTNGKEAKNGLEYLKHLLAQRSTHIFLFGIILSITIVTSLIMFFYFYNFKKVTEISNTFGHDDNLGDGIQVIHREEWLARPPLNSTKINHPLSIVRIMHTGGNYCKDYQTCAGSVLALQGWQVGTQGMPDISYNYLIGGDGNVYVGRGAGVENEWMIKAIDVVYIGNFLAPYDKLTDKMDLAGRRLIDRLRNEGYLTPDYVVIGQNQTANTLSPGENVYSRIVKWAHYDPGLYL